LKRPQQAQQNQKAKPKILFKSVPAAAAAAAVADSGGAAGGGGGPARPIVKTTLEDWTGDGDDDVNGFYASNRDHARRGGRKKRRKNKDTPPPPTNWDDIYDPSRPNSYEEYKDGDEKMREMEDWRDRVLWRRHRRADSYGSDENDAPKPLIGSMAPPQPPLETLIWLTCRVKTNLLHRHNTHLLRQPNKLMRLYLGPFHRLRKVITTILPHRRRRRRRHLPLLLRFQMMFLAKTHMQGVYG
jgi:hypothetical protein